MSISSGEKLASGKAGLLLAEKAIGAGTNLAKKDSPLKTYVLGRANALRGGRELSRMVATGRKGVVGLTDRSGASVLLGDRLKALKAASKGAKSALVNAQHTGASPHRSTARTALSKMDIKYPLRSVPINLRPTGANPARQRSLADSLRGKFFPKAAKPPKPVSAPKPKSLKELLMKKMDKGYGL